jgi:hypothetical protein
MKNVTIHGDYTVAEYFVLNDVIIAIGSDEYGEIFYRISAAVDVSPLCSDKGNELYYRTKRDMVEDIYDFIKESRFEIDNEIYDDLEKICGIIPLLFQ